DRALAELARRDAHVDAARDVGREGAVQRGPELFHALHPEALAAERPHDLFVARVLEPRGDRALLTVELHLPTPNLSPSCVVADHGHDLQAVPREGFELHRVQAERAVA